MALLNTNLKPVDGFSRLTKEKQIEYLSSLFDNPARVRRLIELFSLQDSEFQKRFDEFSENTVASYPLPFGIAPNFNINGSLYHLPMVIEESSVVAAAANAAKFWLPRGGFHTRVISTIKKGQVHFLSDANPEQLLQYEAELENFLQTRLKPLTGRMENRGGGIRKIRIVPGLDKITHYYQLDVDFETVDSMGANFINSCLEEMATGLNEFYAHRLPGIRVEVIMSILSNYVPECLVEARLEAPITLLAGIHPEISPQDFARRFALAIEIARQNVSRAVTHNKGIMNGVDAIVLATGNDFRAVEAGVHAYAARDGHYRSLTQIDLSEGIFNYILTLPLSLGTVGGLTGLHPMAAFALELLGNPSAQELMQIAAAAGLANNFSAVRALTTWGIQKGHMMMHLSNILNTLAASETEKVLAREHFNGHKVSYSAVEIFLNKLRNAGV